MKKFQLPISFGGVGALVGVVIGEFFPKLFQSGLGGALTSGLSEPFSSVRNELAMKYGVWGLAIGAVAGVVAMLVSKK